MKRVLLGDVVQINPSTKVNKGQSVKFISMDKLDPFTKVPNGYEKRKFSSGTKFTNGDTLLARITPCLENGKTAFVDFLDDLEVAAGSTEFVILRNIEGLTDPAYIYYLSISPAFRDYAIKSMVGTSGRQRVQNDVLAKMELSLPPLDQQKKIANILGSLDEKIELNRRMNETLEQLGQALFRHYFVDNPDAKNWNEGTLGDIMNITMGQSPPGKSYNDNGDGVVFYQGRADFGSRYPNIRLFTTDPKRFARVGDVLLTVRAPVGDVNQALERCCIGRGLAAISSRTGAVSFCYYYCHQLKADFLEYNSEGTVFGSINSKQLKALKLKTPPTGLVEKFENEVAVIDKTIILNSYQVKTLVVLRDSLLPKLISGKIEI